MFIFYPLVILHGILSSSEDIQPVQDWFQNHLPSQIEVYNIEIGNGRQNSVFESMNWQLDQLCEKIYSIESLRYGFNFVAISQGGLLARGYVEKCNKFPVKKLITWGTPHEGIFGLNIFPVDINTIYTQYSQQHLSFASYWKEPRRMDDYLKFSTYLPFVNNEIEHTNFRTYKKNFESLEKCVMIWSKNDGVILPQNSARFSFDKEDLKNSRQYLDNLIGLRTLDESKRLFIREVDCKHITFKNECLDEIGEITLHYL